MRNFKGLDTRGEFSFKWARSLTPPRCQPTSVQLQKGEPVVGIFENYK